MFIEPPFYIAPTNERGQISLGVELPARAYPDRIASATWLMQVRRSLGSTKQPILDSTVGGTWTFIGGLAPIVTFRWPASALVNVPSGRAAYDFGFVLPGADFELAGFGEVEFLAGITRPNFPSSPVVPIGAEDTWLEMNPMNCNPSNASTIAATASNQAAAKASADAAAASLATAQSVVTAIEALQLQDALLFAVIGTNLSLDYSLPGFAINH